MKMDADELKALITQDPDSSGSEPLPLSPVPYQEELIMGGSEEDIAQVSIQNPPKPQSDTRSWKQDLNLPIFSLTILSALGGFLFGYDTGVVSGAMLQIQDDPRINLDTFWTELIVSVTVRYIQ